jgi:hypothetical protein
MTKRSVLIALIALFVSAAGFATPAQAAEADVDLSVNLIGPGEAVAGQTADYKLYVSPIEPPADLTAIRAVLTLPAGATFESAAPDGGGPCTAAGATVTCATDQPTGSVDTISWTVTVKIAADLPVGERLRFSMVASAEGTDSRTATFDSHVVHVADLGITAIPPAGKVTFGQPVKYTLVIRNNGPGAVRHFALHESFDDGWYGGGTVTGFGDGECFTDPGRLVCDVVTDLQPGKEVRLEHTLPTQVDEEVRGLKQKIWVEIYPYAGDTDKSNDTVTFGFSFAARSSGSPSVSPSPTTPTLPITGPGDAPSIGLIGLLFLLAGGVTVAATRRFARR